MCRHLAISLHLNVVQGLSSCTRFKIIFGLSFVFKRLLLAVQRVQREQSKIVIILVCEALAVTVR